MRWWYSDLAHVKHSLSLLASLSPQPRVFSLSFSNYYLQPDGGAEPILLALFTTLPSLPQQLLDLYGKRWNIETDLRTLKTELGLDQLNCATPDMADKETEMAIAAYNLVRAVICLAAEQSGLSPRAYGFTEARRIVKIFGPKTAAAANELEARRAFDQMMYYIQQAKLSRRRRKRVNYPRAVWSKGEKFPNRRT